MPQSFDVNENGEIYFSGWMIANFAMVYALALWKVIDIGLWVNRAFFH